MYKAYRFKGQDPVIAQIKTMFLDAGITKVELSLVSGVAPSTHYNWLRGKTKRPQNATIEATGRALGFQRKWVPYGGTNRRPPT